MPCFSEVLVSKNKNALLPEEFDYFGKLIGSWKIDYIDNSDFRIMKGKWHFSWILEGMAIQDVIVLPDFEYGTTIRVYNPGTCAWVVAYCYTGKIMLLEAREQDDMIVLTHIENNKRKWVFAKIEDNHFHWQDITSNNDGVWLVDYDIYATRV